MSLALITGASSGLGVTFARKLAQAGHDVTLVARRQERLAEIAAELMRDYPIRAESLVADLATDDGIAAVVKYINSAPDLEILVNNAGFGTKGLFFDADISGQEQMHRVHVIATMRLSHAALRKMVPQRKGVLINVSSVAAFSIAAGGVSYGATKAWMNAFTEGLDAELRAVGSPVKVQALCPGFTITEFHDTLGMDRSLVPRWLWLPADRVVETSLRALQTGKVIVVTGWQYRLFVKILWLLPGRLVRKLGRASGRRMKRVEQRAD
jgi:short-subunit dehydrogenase